MKEFVYGTKKQYDGLRALLQDDKCEVYHVTLPPSFDRSCCRLGFEKSADYYTVYIDKGIKCTSSKAGPILKDLLRKGEIRFVDFNDIADFFASLKPLF